MNKLARTILAANLLLSLAPLLHANVLGNGQEGPPDQLFPTGTVLAVSSGTVITPTFNTVYKVQVLSDPGNTFCSGCLDFLYQFTNKGPDVNERFTAFNFKGVKVDPGDDPNIKGQEPLTVNRSSTGAAIGFNYTGLDTLDAGKGTGLLVIETNARNFTKGFLSVQDGTAGYAAAFSPVAPTPEPGSLALLGSGLIGLSGFVRKKLRS